MFALMVGSAPHVVDGLDESVSDWIRSRDVFDALRFLDPWGSTEVSLALAVVIGLAALRCRPAALTFAGAIVTGLALHAWLREVVERPRPDAEDILTNSFPSGHVLQAVALAGLLPLALVSITGRQASGSTGRRAGHRRSPAPARSIGCTRGRTGRPTWSAAG